MSRRAILSVAAAMFLAAGAAFAAETGSRQRSVSRQMRDLDRAQEADLIAATAGALAVLFVGSAILGVWRRRPRLARVASGMLLTSLVAYSLGRLVLFERLTPPAAGAFCAAALAAVLVFIVFRDPVSGNRRKKSLAWLKVSSRKAIEPPPQSSSAPDAALAEAEREIELALVLLDASKTDEAVAALERSADIKPTKRAHTYLGTIFGARDDFGRALAELDRALALDAEYAEARDEKALILERMGRIDEAAELRRPRDPFPVTRRRISLPDIPVRHPVLEKASKSASDRGALLKPAATFAAAVVAGSLLALVYVQAREAWARADAASILADVGRGLEALDGDPEPERLARDKNAFSERHPFAAERASTLRLALAIHGYARALEILREGEEQRPVAEWVADWAGRRMIEAKATFASGELDKAPLGMAVAFQHMRDRLGIEILRRKSELDVARQEVPPARTRRGAEAGAWRAIWARPEPGKTFLVEAFTRTSSDGRGFHEDGSPLDAFALYRFRALPASEDGVLAFEVEPLRFSVAEVDPSEGVGPPNVRLVPRESAGPGHLLEYGDGLRFLAMRDTGERSLVKIERERLLGSPGIPLKHLPLFAPGIDPTWEKAEVIRTMEGATVRQMTSWAEDGSRLRIGWRLHYQPEAARYSEQIVQEWVIGSPWWDFYDDGVLFFRARLPRAGE